MKSKVDIWKIHEILTKKYNQNSFGYFLFLGPSCDRIQIQTEDFDLWQKLVYKYSKKDLMMYFIEMLRYYFPELKGAIIDFSKKVKIIFVPKLRHMFFDTYII